MEMDSNSSKPLHMEIETGNNTKTQLYNLKEDPGERHNLADKHPDILEKLKTKLNQIREAGRTL